MTITSEPLRRLLIDSDMNREDLRHQTALSPATISKLGRDGNVTTGVLARICITFIRGVADICSVVAMKENEATDEQF